MNKNDILNSNSQYARREIRLSNGKTSFIYWNNGISFIQKVIIVKGIFVNIQAGDIVLVLNNDLNINDVQSIIMLFFNQLGIDNVKSTVVKLVVNNKLEEEELKGLLRLFNVSFSIEKSQNYVDDLSSEMVSVGDGRGVIQEEPQMDVSNIYYYIDRDDNNKIYNSYNALVGVLNSNGYMADEYNVNDGTQKLFKDGKQLGVLVDYRNMSSAKGMGKPKTKVYSNGKFMSKVYSEPVEEENIEFNSRAAFISFPIILLVMSVLFFIASIILYIFM